MTRFALVTLIAAITSLFIFPWPFTAMLALLSAPFIPLAPLALGIMADALYFVPGSALPLATIAGGIVTLLALFVRARLTPGIIAS